MHSSFCERNKIIIWVLIFIIIGVIIYFSLNRKDNNTLPPTPTPANVVVSISPKSEVTVGVGYSTYLFAMVESNPNALFSWKSSDTSIATVLNGTVVGIKNGKATITATYTQDGKDYTINKEVTVVSGNSSVNLEDVNFPNGELYMPVNSSYQLNPILCPANAFVTEKVYSSSDKSIVTVTDDGMVSAVREGHTTINLTVNNKFKKSINVHVGNYPNAGIIVNPESIILSVKSMKIKVETMTKLSYTVTPNNIDQRLLTWSTSDSSVVTVDNNGNIKGIKAGIATVGISSYNGIKDTIDIEVMDNFIEISNILLPNDEISMNAGETDTIVPVILPNNASNKVLEYASSNNEIVSVSLNSDGQTATISALSEGTAIITVKGGSVEGKVTINVKGTNNSNTEDEGNESLPTTIKVRSDKNNLAKTLEDAKKISVEGISTVSVILRDGVYKVKYCLNKIDATSPCTPNIDMYSSFPVTIPSGNIFVLRIKKYDANNNEISSTSPNYIDKVLNYYINTNENKEEIKVKQYEITGAYFNTTYSKTYPLNINESVNIRLLDNKRYLLVCYTNSSSCTPNIKVTSNYSMKLDNKGTWRVIVEEYDTNNNKLGNKEVYFAYVK